MRPFGYSCPTNFHKYRNPHMCPQETEHLCRPFPAIWRVQSNIPISFWWLTCPWGSGFCQRIDFAENDHSGDLCNPNDRNQCFQLTFHCPGDRCPTVDISKALRSICFFGVPLTWLSPLVLVAAWSTISIYGYTTN